jgi:hypothetical protein
VLRATLTEAPTLTVSNDLGQSNLCPIINQLPYR